jgi:Winged helix DNA-binding domain
VTARRGVTGGSGEVRVLSQRELNRATLARQMLLERRRLPLVTAVERLAGLQGQWSPSPFVGLWSRLQGFRRASLERALARREIVKALVMRGTLHLVSRADYAIFASALTRGGASPIQVDALEFAETIADDVRGFFGEEPRSRAEVFEWLGSEYGRQDLSTQALSWYAIRVRAHVVHAPASAMWRSPTSPAFEALPDVVLPDPAAARVELVRRYLGAFGPSTKADIANWTGIRVMNITPALEALEPLRRFRNEAGRELLDLPRAPLPPADTPAPVRFLPKWDSVLLGHEDRTRVLPAEYRGTMIGGNGDVPQAILVDGSVAGTWAVSKGRVSIHAFEPLTVAAQEALAEEAARLEAFLANG